MIRVFTFKNIYLFLVSLTQNVLDFIKLNPFQCADNCPQGKLPLPPPPLRVRVWTSIRDRVRDGDNFCRGQLPPFQVNVPY